MSRILQKLTGLFCAAVLLIPISACGNLQTTKDHRISTALEYDHSLELQYAEQFAVDYYQEGYVLLTIAGKDRYLLIPQGKDAPEDLEKDVIPLSMPVQKGYLVASAAMDYFVALDAMDHLRFSGLKTDGWYLKQAKDAMEQGTLLYAGKYAAPDYEKIVSEHCDLAIENTMIFHTPEVKEQLERLGIPVLVDYSSYESTPQGRMEWVKLYGVLTGKEQEAQTIFAEQVQRLEAIAGQKPTGKTVAFFYITSNGEVNVRRASDYVPKMISLAGGTYAFPDLGKDDSSAASTVALQMEAFYAVAKDADYLIYNSTIDGELSSLESLLKKNALLKNCRAVQNGNVFCTTKNLYQASMSLGVFTEDLHKMLIGDVTHLTYLYPLE